MSEKATRKIVAERSGGLCERCGYGAELTMHHRRNRSAGGPWTPVNIVHLHGSGTTGCHGYVTEHPDAAAEEGFHVRSFENEADIPVRWFGTMVYLQPDGTVIPA